MREVAAVLLHFKVKINLKTKQKPKTNKNPPSHLLSENTCTGKQP